MLKAIEWKQHKLFITDQTKLPERVVRVPCRTPQHIADAIRGLKICGASAIGVAAAFAVYLGVKTPPMAKNYPKLLAQILKTTELLKSLRCSDMNLYWALDRMRHCAENNRDHKLSTLRDILLREAMNILKEDEKTSRTISLLGSDLLRSGDSVLTYGNAGALASAGMGSALGMLAQAAAKHQDFQVLVAENRPYLHGARLTALELKAAKIPFKLITDNAAAFLMRQGRVHVVVVGARRIAMNGDVVGDIGTYGLAMLAYHHNIPFYVAAPVSSFDRGLHTADHVVLGERKAEEIIAIHGKPISVTGVKALNPVCDVTPHKYISALISDLGVVRAPYDQNLRNLFSTLI